MRTGDPQAEWDKRYSELSAFREKFGRLHVPAENPASRQLDEWLAEQITRHNSLEPGQIRKLLQLGVDFGPREMAWYQFFFEVHDYVRSQSKFPERRSSLARWLERQRARKRRGTLPLHYVRWLDSIGIVWDPGRKTFAERLKDLKAFKAKYGHCNVPFNYDEIPDLGRFVCMQLRSGREKRSLEELRELDAIGFVWDAREDLWLRRFNELKAFQERFHAYPTRSTNHSLASWVHTQRITHPSPERVRLLNEIGFQWENPRGEYWKNRYLELKAFRQQFGHCRVPRNAVYHHLHSWVYDQRKRTHMPPSQRKLLDELGIDWTLKPPVTREERIAELEAFYQEHGHCNIEYEENQPLARWLGTIRRKKDRLPVSFRQKLEAMGIDWNPRGWDRRYAEAAAVNAQYGCPEIQTWWKANRKVWAWLHAERNRWDRLTAEQKRLMIDLDPSLHPTFLDKSGFPR